MSLHNDPCCSVVAGADVCPEAESFFSLYQARLDHFVYNILHTTHVSLDNVRKSSPLLLAAICVVGALHQPSSAYEACYQHFVRLASTKMFSKTQEHDGEGHDDVRGLLIGAMWLPDISWTLVAAGKAYRPSCGSRSSLTQRTSRATCRRAPSP